MIFSENRIPPLIKSGAGSFRIMLKPVRDFSNQLPRPDLIPEQTFADHAPGESACVRSAQTALRDCGGQSRQGRRSETVASRRFAAVIFAAAGTDRSRAPVDPGAGRLFFESSSLSSVLFVHDLSENRSPLFGIML
jgi:hypothetical protein